MAKQFILIVLLSIAAVFFRAQLSNVLDGLVIVHNGIAEALLRVFSTSEAGRFIQDIIALLVIPALIGAVFCVGFWLIKREMMPHTMLIIWVVWLVLLTTMVAQHGMQKAPDDQTGGANAAQVSSPVDGAPAGAE